MSSIFYIVWVLIPWVLKTLLYHFGFRWRHIHATLQTKIIVAGAPLVVRGIVPFPLGTILVFFLAVGLGLYLCKKFTDGKLFPDLVIVVGSVEIVGLILIDQWIMPILRSTV